MNLHCDGPGWTFRALFSDPKKQESAYGPRPQFHTLVDDFRCYIHFIMILVHCIYLGFPACATYKCESIFSFPAEIGLAVRWGVAVTPRGRRRQRQQRRRLGRQRGRRVGRESGGREREGGGLRRLAALRRDHQSVSDRIYGPIRI